ncbi:MAG: PQQ-like beta-propeller repeat protein [Planctomycetes bacterium]|nr:PQQ-like beta-propeller repeat protein [Planctomycetota bacterium]
MRIITGLLLLTLGFPCLAADWPQYRGPNRDDISADKGLLPTWPKAGPTLLWTYSNAGVGYSGPAIMGDRYYTIGGRGDDEFLIALDIKTIKDNTVAEAWAVKVGPLFQFKSNSWSSGPSTTPTVDGDLIYAIGGNGDLLCVTAADGKEKWRKNLPSEFDAQVNPIGGGPKNLGWGFTCSPLVDGEQLICLTGGPKGTLTALDKKTGNLLWRSTELKDQAAYASPVVAEIEGVRQYVVLTNQGLAGLNAKDGTMLWSFRRKPAYGTEVVNTPIVQGAFVYATVGAGGGCDLLKIAKDGDKFKADVVYANKNMANHHGNVVLFGEHVYGHSGRAWACQDFKSGEIVWEERAKLGSGSMTYADGHFYCFGENDGQVVLIEASKVGWKEGGRFKLPQQSKLRKPSGKIWTPPVVANGRLFLRDQDLVFCYDVKAKE